MTQPPSEHPPSSDRVPAHGGGDPPSIQRLFSRIAKVGIWIVLVLSPLIYMLWPWPFDDHCHVCTIEIDDHLSIQVTADVFWEVNQGLYFQIWRDGAPLHDAWSLGGTVTPLHQLEFEVVTTVDGDSFALVERAAPDALLVLYSGKSNYWYPGGPGGLTSGERWLERKWVLDQLRKRYPDRKFTLDSNNYTLQRVY